MSQKQPKGKNKKTAVLTMSHKGGAGKSTFARGLLDHLRRFGLEKILAMDGQPNVGHLSNFYGLKSPQPDGSMKYDPALNREDIFGGVLEFDARSTEIKKLGDILDMNPEFILVDMPGGAVQEASRAFGGGLNSFVDVYKDEGFDIVVALAVNNLKASSQSLADIVKAWGTDGIRYAAVRNLGVAERDQFHFFDGHRAAEAGSPAALIKSLGGVVFDMPKLDADTYAYVDAAEVAFSDYAENRQLAGRSDRERMKTWLKLFDLEVYDKLGLIENYSPAAVAEFEATRKTYFTPR